MIKKILLFITVLLCSSLINASPKVYFFLQTECPLSQQYISQINELYSDFSDEVEMTAVFPLPDDSNDKINQFKKKYKLDIPIIRDINFNLTDSLQATVTPEVVIVDDESGAIIYSGPIDNRVIRLGKYRNVVDKSYVRENLQLLLNNEKVRYTKETPIGCIISSH